MAQPKAINSCRITSLPFSGTDLRNYPATSSFQVDSRMLLIAQSFAIPVR